MKELTYTQLVNLVILINPKSKFSFGQLADLKSQIENILNDEKL